MVLTPDNMQDIIDSRDVIERIEELEMELSDLSLEEESEAGDKEEEELNEELTALRSLAEEAEQYASDWQYGEALIRDSHFTDYARELAYEVSEAPSSFVPWPNNHIDWDAAAEELQQDYTEVDFGGVIYWVRAF